MPILKTKRILIPLFSFLSLVFAWHIAIALFRPPKVLLPGPLDIIYRIQQFGPAWTQHCIYTIKTTLLGFLIAIIFGVGISVFIIHSRFISAAVTPLLVILQVIPKIAFAPLLLIWFGSGDIPIIFIAFLVSFFPIVIDTTIGLTEIEPELLDLTRCYHMSKPRVLAQIRFPNSLPFFFSGAKVASTLSVIGAIIGEFVGSNKGLGYLVIIANNNLDTSLAMGSIFFISIFGLALFGAIVILERLCMPWKVESGQGLVSLT